MATYKIKRMGLYQRDLVNLLKDIETVLGGTNSNNAITVTVAATVASVAASASTSAITSHKSSSSH